MNVLKQKISRRQFFGYGISGFALALLAACAKSSSDDTTTGTPAVQGGDCPSNGATVTIGSNHGHSASAIANTDVNTGTQQVYNLSGGGHSHTFTLSAANFTTLHSNTGVTVTTDADATGHSHTITVNCA